MVNGSQIDNGQKKDDDSMYHTTTIMMNCTSHFRTRLILLWCEVDWIESECAFTHETAKDALLQMHLES